MGKKKRTDAAVETEHKKIVGKITHKTDNYGR